MKRAAAFAVAGSALALTLSLARAHSSDAARPDGVAANTWIPITPDAGFVVTGSGSQATQLGRAVPSVKGYLMVRRNDNWVRLEPEAAGRVMPTNQ